MRIRLGYPVAELHLRVTVVGLGVQGGVEVSVEERDQFFSEEGSSGHPLEVAAAAVVVGTVELASGEGLLEPAEEGLVIGVHPQGDVRLAAVSSEVAFADQEPQEDAYFQNGRVVAVGGRRSWGSFSGLFHRRVSRGTWTGLFHRRVSRETGFLSMGEAAPTIVGRFQGVTGRSRTER